MTSISEDASVLNVDWRYPAGSTVPGHTGILLGGEAGNYTGEYSVANVACPEDNLLDGTLEEATIADAGYKYYKLADGNDGLGFYLPPEAVLPSRTGRTRHTWPCRKPLCRRSTSLHSRKAPRAWRTWHLRTKSLLWMSTVSLA